MTDSPNMTPAHHRVRPRGAELGRRLRLASSGQRQFLALGLAAFVALLAATVRPGFLSPTPEAWPLLAWSAYAWTQVGFVVLLAALSDAHTTRRRAQRNDPGAALLSALVLAVACVSLVAVVLAVHSAHTLQGPTRWTHLLLAALSLAGSWALIQCAFALRYARLHYRLAEDGTHEGGLQFPGSREPSYLDFLYQAAVVGMTSQTADVDITSPRMRALTLAHSAVAFVFNLVVLALTINVVASALT